MFHKLIYNFQAYLGKHSDLTSKQLADLNWGHMQHAKGLSQLFTQGLHLKSSEPVHFTPTNLFSLITFPVLGAMKTITLQPYYCEFCILRISIQVRSYNISFLFFNIKHGIMPSKNLHTVTNNRMHLFLMTEQRSTYTL